MVMGHDVSVLCFRELGRDVAIGQCLRREGRSLLFLYNPLSKTWITLGKCALPTGKGHPPQGGSKWNVHIWTNPVRPSCI